MYLKIILFYNLLIFISWMISAIRSWSPEMYSHLIKYYIFINIKKGPFWIVAMFFDLIVILNSPKKHSKLHGQEKSRIEFSWIKSQEKSRFSSIKSQETDWFPSWVSTQFHRRVKRRFLLKPFNKWSVVRKLFVVFI